MKGFKKNRSSNNKKDGDSKKRVLIRKFYRREQDQKRWRSFIKKSVIFSALALIVFSLGIFFIYKYNYSHYEPIIKSRIESGFWQSRAGIYAAPKSLRAGQKLSQDELVALLKKSGYIEGDTVDTFWNGTFNIGKNFVEVKKNRASNSKSNTARIVFENGKIQKITDGSYHVSQ